MSCFAECGVSPVCETSQPAATAEQRRKSSHSQMSFQNESGPAGGYLQRKACCFQHCWAVHSHVLSGWLGSGQDSVLSAERYVLQGSVPAC